MNRRGITMDFMFFIALTILFWGLAPIFGKIGLVNVEPLVGLAIRTLVIGLILAAVCILTGKISQIAQVSPRDIFFIGAEGICASLLGHLAYYYSLKLGDVSTVFPLLAAYPAVTVLLAVLLLGEQFTWNKFLGVAAIIIGVILVRR